ncbi:hypothetical protein HYFRA_00010839 [Hymenoscyphus fraxineus]|uniref:DUF6594 domain-containing protein n=1 Tax=Hymenoscyphus fraxineus TaxID=746836 RepID=A0A9N9KWG0_9HELO|nr:hypothetical protein HYFRA_00010839 [Hymenoscyphus fraxineus]
MVSVSQSSDSSSIQSQLSGTVVGSAQVSPQGDSFPKTSTNNVSSHTSPSSNSLARPVNEIAESTRTSSPPPCSLNSQHACLRSKHPGDPQACPTVYDTPSEPVPGQVFVDDSDKHWELGSPSIPIFSNATWNVLKLDSLEWPQVSRLMSDTPEFASFNRFSDLQIKSLLYYQAQIEILKQELQDEEWEDYRRGDDTVSKYCEQANNLVLSEAKQWEKMKEIRKLLKEYNEALLQFSQVSALPKPETHNLNSLMKWLINPDAGDQCINGGQERYTWGNICGKEPPPKSFKEVIWSLIWSKPDPPCTLDLASTHPKAPVDSLSRWVAGSFVPWWADWKPWWADWKEARKRNKESDAEKTTAPESPRKTRDQIARDTLTRYSGASIVRFTSSLTTVVACLLPTIAITVLSQVHGLGNLLLCLAGFAIVFAAGLIFLGTASRVEIFGATAAFSAVLVVFISVPIVIVPPSGVPYTPNT